ncbi:hypothetical protein DTO021D3_2250 [Paecilomyces variotii]|nr:hypothetical protein DTO032I3_2200 [Paecilomyces variotii]KAJ9280780.1 hypothetical protein DTO021D3_2250 [Paecilomyces variotii]KAJ9345176.1 hypothetical protein DTO027B6_2321 [Paecilomyces variotii]KAJ9390320.1 hypothetical protein DTO032I4_1846 [Paecilomyces variotii]
MVGHTSLCSLISSLAVTATLLHPVVYAQKCEKTKVAILGGGTAGITAAQALTNASIHDFIIVEYNADIGGRVAHTDFGKDTNGNPYTVELGANWVQGLGSAGGPENPIWTLAKKYNLTNTYSDYSSILTYNKDGYSNYSDLIDDYENGPYSEIEYGAGIILTENLLDQSFRAASSLAGWKPQTPEEQAVEWWEIDWEYSYPPEECSETYTVVNYNTTFYQFSEANNLVIDQRGFNAFIKGMASTFLQKNDSRLRLNTIVTNISYTDDSVSVFNHDGSCIEADYAISTFSLGVLQHDVITFDPPLPKWKKQGIANFAMGTYTKIFLQFKPEDVFWDKNTQFFLYADPTRRGYYTVWQSLDTEGFLPGSGIIFATVLNTESYRIEKMSDDETKKEALAVLKTMFPEVEKIPDPIAFMYPRWTETPWSYGSYSNWPVGVTLEMHQNLRANVSNLYFAGEATHPEYYGFLQGAYFEGKAAAEAIASCVKNNGCVGGPNYPVLHGTTEEKDLTSANGWTVSPFETWGYD